MPDTQTVVMNTYGLQQSLMKEIARLLGEMHLKNTEGNETEIHGYEQRLPKLTEDEEDPSQFFPYFIVQLMTGNTEDDYDPWHVRVIIQLGIFDDDKEANGHRQLLSMIQKISDRFLEYPLLDNAFRAEQNMDWELLDEDTYPYYFAGLEMKFYVPKQGRSDDYA